MSNVVTIKVDVRKLDKARFFEGKPDKNGHRPLYADLVLMPKKEVGQYGDTHICKQSVTKAEREAKLEMPIIGNATERGVAPAPRQSAPPPRGAPAAGENLDEDCPY